MDINLTLLGELITFSIFVWFTMRFVWPPIMQAIQERENQIADGLAKGEQGKKDLELARGKATEFLKEAKGDAATLLESANQRADRLMREAKEVSQQEGVRMIDAAKEEIEQMVRLAKGGLQKEVVNLSVAIAEKMIKGLDSTQQQALLDEALKEEGA